MEAMNSQQVKNLMIDYLVNTHGVPAEMVTNGGVKVETLGVDSLAMLEMLFEVEEKYGIHVEDFNPLKGMTIDALAEFLAGLQETAAV